MFERIIKLRLNLFCDIDINSKNSISCSTLMFENNFVNGYRIVILAVRNHNINILEVQTNTFLLLCVFLF